MSERRGFKDQISDVLTEALPDPTGSSLEQWLAPTTESRIEQIPVEQVRDRAVRGDVDVTEPAYRALRASIRASGVLQPLLLRPHADGGYEVVSGARRLRAARDTAQSTIPAVVRELNDVQALVGGSWDAVLRTGLSVSESRALVAQLVTVGMGEGEATALVGTVPVRDEPAGADAAAEVAAAIEAAFEPETVVAPAAAPDADVAVPPDAEAATASESEAVLEPVAAESAPEEAVAAAEPDIDIDIDIDEDVLGWPSPEDAPTATAPTTPPAPLPIDPAHFPVAPLGEAAAAPESTPAAAAEPSSNGDAPAATVTDESVETTPEAPSSNGSPAASVTAVPTEPAAPEVTAPDPITLEIPAPAITPDSAVTDEPAVVVAPVDASAAAGVTPHVIRINLPDATTAVAGEPDTADGSMPVAAPAAATDADQGSRLLTPPTPAEPPEPATTAATVPTLPALLRRGPLFYAVLGIGLAVGAIVFILTSVLEGVGGTTSIIAAVVVAVVGFVAAMVSLAQPRQRS
ncbi:MAG TPA: ParB/RepB/Spo0J family partition protein [Candidatus Angelobacter sp.]|jgi:hypothetical protein|nr:ParB/RepB/Spo0J family partition protein [Candidatus Angelobacter sp.]